MCRPLCAAVAAAGRGKFTLDGVARMRERPIQDLVDGLVQLGVDALCTAGTGCPPVAVNAQGLPTGTVRTSRQLPPASPHASKHTSKTSQIKYCRRELTERDSQMGYIERTEIIQQAGWPRNEYWRGCGGVVCDFTCLMFKHEHVSSMSKLRSKRASHSITGTWCGAQQSLTRPVIEPMGPGCRVEVTQNPIPRTLYP